MALDVLKMAGSDWRWFPWRQRQHKETSTASSDGSHEPKHSCSTARAFSSAYTKYGIQATNTSGPAQEILVFIALESSDGLCKPKHSCSPARAFATRIHKVWK